MNFSNFNNDIVSLIKENGTIIENIKANVQPDMIFIHDEKLPLEENDKIYRKLPNGLFEIYVVVDRGFYSKFHNIPAHFQAKVRKEGNIQKDKCQSIRNVYNINGANSRININSTDNSSNISDVPNLLFDDIKKSLETIKEGEIQELSLKILEELKRTQNTSSFTSNYQKFIASLANHMTLIAPFIPALTQLIK